MMVPGNRQSQIFSWVSYTNVECWILLQVLEEEEEKEKKPARVLFRHSLTHSFSPVSNNLQGPIPNELCLLEHLVSLDLANNHLTGTIPTCLITSRSSLQRLVLRKNLLTGALPRLSGNSELMTVDVSHNRLTGGVGELLPAKLQELHLNDNGFTGKISTWKKPGGLTSLTLAGNQLTGMVPFCGLTELTADCDEVLCDCCSNCQGDV